MGYEYDWSVVLRPDAWFEAIYITLLYGLGTTIIGLLLGLGLGLVLIGSWGPGRWAVQLFIGLFRCTPALIQIVWFYYAFPIVLGINLPAWLAAGCGLTFYMAAFSAEIFRGGVQSIDQRQWSACRSLCMSYWQTMWHVILPQTIRRMTPAIVNQAIIQFKNTSLLSVVAVHDLMYTANALTAETYRPLEVLTFAALIYIVIIWPMASLTNYFERRAQRRLA